MRALNSYTFTVAVNATLHDGGFAITAPGLAGKTMVTSAAVTQQILDSPEFDQLLFGDKATRILEIVLAQAAHKRGLAGRGYASLRPRRGTLAPLPRLLRHDHPDLSG